MTEGIPAQEHHHDTARSCINESVTLAMKTGYIGLVLGGAQLAWGQGFAGSGSVPRVLARASSFGGKTHSACA
jgi:hypothetical protein